MPGVSVPVFAPPAGQAFAWREELACGPRTMRVFGKAISILKYDPARYPLATAFVRHLAVQKAVTLSAGDSLEERGLGALHEYVALADQQLDDHEETNVQRTVKGVNGTFGGALSRMLGDVLVKALGCDCLYQANPTVRIHFPWMSGRKWRDRVHADWGLGHPPCEVNAWLPLCRVGGTAGMRIAGLEKSTLIYDRFKWDHKAISGFFQSEVGAAWWGRNSEQLELDYGEMLVFDSRCLHAAQYNRERYTRVSVDTRVVPVEDLAASRVSYVGTGKMRMAFERGAYYADDVLRAA